MKNDSAKKGKLIWLTGLSGCGKTTIAKELLEKLNKNGHWILVDGDEIRELFGSDLGHDLNDRKANAYRISKICQWLAGQGADIICATMSLFHEIHEWNRKNIPNYYEVYIRVPFEILEKRHPQNLYALAKAGKMKGVIGVDLPFEEPLHPNLVLDNIKSADSLAATVNSLYEELRKENYA